MPICVDCDQHVPMRKSFQTILGQGPGECRCMDCQNKREKFDFDDELRDAKRFGRGRHF